jgi:chromosome segregation ATPase
MNVESLKSELQQVLDNDIVLRKEFTTLKRSLSDYRNQLIMRDEDCKRLQVTIDVLNTKLVVMERDNKSYKGELVSFKELRGTIKEQLDAKQEEINARLIEIQSLKDDLNSISIEYESKIAHVKNEASVELENVKQKYSSQIEDLKSNGDDKETGIREDYESRLTDLNNLMSSREQDLLLNHEEELTTLKNDYEQQITNLLSEYKTLSQSNQEEVESLKASHQNIIQKLEEDFKQKYDTSDLNYKTEVTNLREALEEQRQTLTSNFNTRIENLKIEHEEKEKHLISSYEEQLETLKQTLSSTSQDVTLVFQNQISELKLVHETSLTETHANFKTQLDELTQTYETKLSNTLIHSNSQNSKLTEGLNNSQLENNRSLEKIQELILQIDTQNANIENLSVQLSHFQTQLTEEANRFFELNNEFEAFKQTATLSNNEHVNQLNNQIDNLNVANAEVVNQLNSQIIDLNNELKNLAVVFETTTNNLSETEIALELKVQELENARMQIESLNADIELTKQSKAETNTEIESFKAQANDSFLQIIEAKEVEYQKLLVENASLINEIDLAQDKIEAQETEVSLLKGELEEVKLQSAGKVEFFKEILANKNFEITNLEANQAALNQELQLVKLEADNLQSQLQESSQPNESLSFLQNQVALFQEEKSALLLEIASMQTITTGLKDSILDLNEKISTYENDIQLLRSNGKVEEHEAFIDKLFKQIDQLNDERLLLLDEKEQMGNQLLKMNNALSNLSQEVDSEQIEVSGLNNHRKNVILAKNSDGFNEKSQMKEQINDLVREIDKCIALLST